MKNTKTFWSVDYSVWGNNGVSTAWFDSKTEAEEFAKKDYRDLPIRHTVSRADTISKYDELVSMTKYEFA